MTIPYQILIGDHKMPDAANIIENVFYQVNLHFNNWNPGSEISQINQLPAGQAHNLSPHLAKLLSRAGELVVMTDGRFDPTVAPLFNAWKTSLAHHLSPNKETIAQIQKCVGWHSLAFNGDTVTKAHTGTKLDLCGIAKGYAVDLIIERLNAAGYKNVHVTWGGEVRASGHHPSGRLWNAAVASPTRGSPLALVPLANCAIATSGDYEQIWLDQDGSAYTHICDPSSGKPLQLLPGRIASATVVAPTCFLADGLATALMLAHSKEEAEKLIAKWEDAFPEVSILVAICDSV